MSAPRSIAATALPEQELVACVRAGDPRAFEALFKTHYRSLRVFVATYVEDATAEEVTQELFLAIWRKRESWSPVGGIRAYLFAAARNRALNAIRKRRSVARMAEQVIAAAEGNPPPDSAHVEAEAECRQAIYALPESNRLVMRLRWGYGMSHAEIAFVLGTSIKGVEAQLSRGLLSLATRLAHLRA